MKQNVLFCALLSFSSAIFTIVFPKELPKDYVSKEEVDQKRNKMEYEYRILCYKTEDDVDCGFEYLALKIPYSINCMVQTIAFLQHQHSGMISENITQQILNDPIFQEKFLQHPYVQQHILELIEKKQQQTTQDAINKSNNK